MKRGPGRWLAVAAAGLLSLPASEARAHLIAAQQGTVNLVGPSAFVVLSVPTAALHGVDDSGDGVISLAEFHAHEAAIKAEIDRRLAVSNGATDATTVSLDLVLSPLHEAPTDRATQIVALKHAKFAAPPGEVRIVCDLFGAREDERTLNFTATRKREGAEAEKQTTVLTPTKGSHTFFAAAPAAPSAPGRSASGVALLCGAAFGAALGVSRKRSGNRV